MAESFFGNPILNSPYEYPSRHWELDGSGQPTHRVLERRRSADFVTPIPTPKKRSASDQAELSLDGRGLSTEDQQYDPASVIIARVRQRVDQWRARPDPRDWQVTPQTARLLQHWRNFEFDDLRPFFCQVEAVETLIYLTEVAPKAGKAGRQLLEHLEAANASANPLLSRISLKLATGAGKTTVMAMVIAWQTINAVRRPRSSMFSRGFLVVAPGLTIRDRLRVLRPNDPDSDYRERQLVPGDMMGELSRAKIVITNYHAFKRRDTLELSRGNRALLQGRGPALQTLETDGQVLQRVMPELMGLSNILVLNDEAHHCYRQKPGEAEEHALTGDDRREAEDNKRAARLWVSGLEAVSRVMGVRSVVDLSATPFFLRGSGYAEGTLFPWTVSDFSLMDAIECGIVKLPRVPVADNLPGHAMPVYRDLWPHIGKRMPRRGRGKNTAPADPLSLPAELQTALEALYGHYARTFELWAREGIDVPPCFIVVCNNTATSKLVYDYIAGFYREDSEGSSSLHNGRLPLLRNFDDDGEPLPRPRTLLIDSRQLESGDALDPGFRSLAADEIERFRREVIQRTGDRRQAESLSDQDLLREVMNTVGKRGRLGETVRCVVSVSMLTEGWDANTVTHVLGVRAFGTQLLCEQVIGRALRRRSYSVGPSGRFAVEYADVLGIPFDFMAEPVVATPEPPRQTVQVRAVRPERDHLAISFPRVEGYRVELPDEHLRAEFTEDSTLVLTPELVGPSITNNADLVGEAVDLTLEHLEGVRRATLLFHLTRRLLFMQWRDPAEEPKLYLFGQLKRIVRQWLDEHLVCTGGTYPAQLLIQELADLACERIGPGITRTLIDERPVRAVVDPYNPTGSTTDVHFQTSKKNRWSTDPSRCHVNWAVFDSEWEAEFCRAAEAHPRVKRYVKNHNLGLEVPYVWGGESRRYRPDFIVVADDGHGEHDPLHLVAEIKGFRREDATHKKDAMETYWIPAVNNLGVHGRWAFAEFDDVHTIASALDAQTQLSRALERASATAPAG